MNLCVEVGFIIASPIYQRTHFTTNMIGLLLQYLLPGAAGEWKAGISPGAMASKRTERGIDQGSDEDGLPLRGGEEVGSRCYASRECHGKVPRDIRDNVRELMKPVQLAVNFNVFFIY